MCNLSRVMRIGAMVLALTAAAWASPEVVVARTDGATVVSRTSSRVVHVDATGRTRTTDLDADGVRRSTMRFPSPDLAPKPTSVHADTQTVAAAPQSKKAARAARRLARRNARRTRRGFLSGDRTQAQVTITRSAHPTGRPGFAVRRLGDAVRRPGMAVERPGHAVNRPGISVTRGGHPVTRGGHPVTRGGHAVSRSGHPVSRGAHPVSRGSHSVGRPGFSLPRSSFVNRTSSFSSSGSFTGSGTRTRSMIRRAR